MFPYIYLTHLKKKHSFQYSGAASEAVKEGIPSAAFSGVSGSEVSYTTLDSSPSSTSTLAALTYAALTIKFLSALLSTSSTPILPPNVSLNVNYPAIDSCTSVSDFDFVLSRIYSDSSAVDVDTCGSTHLPTESTVVNTDGCFASVSVFNSKFAFILCRELWLIIFY